MTRLSLVVGSMCVVLVWGGLVWAAVTANLVRAVDTTAWSPAAPGPAGVVYLAARDSLIVVDSDRNNLSEFDADGINLWEYSLATGTVTNTGALPTDEPTGAGYDPATNTLFISDDNPNRVYLVRPGDDGWFGTGDDPEAAEINTGALGAGDTEDPAFDPATGHLFVLSGTDSEIYDIDPVDGVFGNGNDATSLFAVPGAPDDWEGLALDEDSGHLLVGAKSEKLIYEITKTGALVRIIDASGIGGMQEISGLGVQPGSGGSNPTYWVADRGDTPIATDGMLFELIVGPVPPTPPVAQGQSVETSMNVPVDVTLTATDVNGDDVTYEIVADPAHGNLTGTPPDVTYTPVTGYTGPDEFTFRAHDGAEYSNTATVSITVITNQAPVLDTIGSQNVNEGSQLSFTAAATDPEDDNLSYSLEGSPPVGAAITPGGLFTWTPTEAQGPDSFNVTVRVTDDGSPIRWDQETFSVGVAEVNQAPVIATDPGNPTNAAGDTVSLIIDASDSDVPANSLTWSAVGLPPGLGINPVTGEVSGTIGADAAAGSPYAVTVTVTDNGSPARNDQVGFTWTIVSKNHVPVVGPPVGLVDPTQGMWHLRNSVGAVTSFFYGNPGDIPFVGDWDCDGDDTPGLFRQSDAFAYLRNSNTQGIGDIRFFFGNPSDIPLAGDFNGNGCDTLSLYRPSTQEFFIINELGENEGGLGAAEFSFLFGNPGDKPVVGDWDGDGFDEVGLHRESTGFFYWRDSLDTGIADGTIFFGDPGDRFVAGDWGIVDGVDTPAVFRPSDTTFYFRHTLTEGVADTQFVFGKSGWLPVAGQFGLG